ncbi:hypothetical protein Trydic_g16393 [Trypoxylus dichotomus]
MKYLRRVQRVTKLDKIRSEQIRTDLRVQPVLEFTVQRLLSCWGHLTRINDRRVVKTIWEARISARRKRDRAKESWVSTIGNILDRRRTTLNEATVIAFDKNQWRKCVCS